MWREDVETFAAQLALVHADGGRQARWFGAYAAQYPTVESLAQALAAHGVGLDHASLAVVQHYQRDVWDAFGACAISGVHAAEGQRRLAAVTPRGRMLTLGPAPQRDRRSHEFGPPIAEVAVVVQEVWVRRLRWDPTGSTVATYRSWLGPLTLTTTERSSEGVGNGRS